MFNSIKGKYYDRMNFKLRFCIDVIRFIDEEEYRENNYKVILFLFFDKEVCYLCNSNCYILLFFFYGFVVSCYFLVFLCKRSREW